MDYSPWLDPHGYPGCRQSDGSFDGGDTAAILGTIMTLSREVTETVVKRLPEACPFDIFYQQPLRHPDRKKWYGLPNHYSRDQLIPMLCGAIGSDLVIDRLYRSHKKRWFLTAWNTQANDGSAKNFPANCGDICGPEVWALWIRYYKPWWGWLVLTFLDVQTLIGAVQWRWFTPKSNQVCRNHMLVSMTMLWRQPSLLSPVVYWVNDWADLIERWRACNRATGEFPTADLFALALLISK